VENDYFPLPSKFKMLSLQLKVLNWVFRSWLESISFNCFLLVRLRIFFVTRKSIEVKLVSPAHCLGKKPEKMLMIR
jgi:hypothetical protein